MPDITVPPVDDWPYDARVSVIGSQNTAKELRVEIDSIVGNSDPNWVGQKRESRCQFFTARELAQLLLALGGPQDD